MGSSSANGLSKAEQEGVDYYVRFHQKVVGKRAEGVSDAIDAVSFDLDQFTADVDGVIEAPLLEGVLATAQIADELLQNMFLRQDEPRLEMKSLLNALGPLGDFNKRLKVAALAGFIDHESLVFFDNLRRVRNKIAHSRKPSPPTKEQVAKLIDGSPQWLESLRAAGRVSVGDNDRHGTAVLRAAMVMQLTMLAWQCLSGPAVRRAEIPMTAVLNCPPAIFGRLSQTGIYRAEKILNGR